MHIYPAEHVKNLFYPESHNLRYKMYKFKSHVKTAQILS